MKGRNGRGQEPIYVPTAKGAAIAECAMVIYEQAGVAGMPPALLAAEVAEMFWGQDEGEPGDALARTCAVLAGGRWDGETMRRVGPPIGVVTR